jgi:hypothetical protein
MRTRDIAEIFNKGATFICAYSHPKAFEFLTKPENLSKVNAALNPFDREIKHSKDDELFYVAPTSLSHKEDANELKTKFESIRDKIYLIVSFIELTIKGKQSSGALQPGQTLRYSSLLDEISKHEHLKDALIKTVRLISSKKASTDPKEQLELVFKDLVGAGILVVADRTSGIYQTTGMIAYIYKLIQKINDYEEVEFTLAEEEQEELML